MLKRVKMRKEDWMEMSLSLETSPDIMEEIWLVSKKRTPMAIWEDPLPDEAKEILKGIMRKGTPDDFCWGASGPNWARDLGLKGEDL